MFSVDSPTAVRGVDKLIPVDVYIPDCSPRPEAVMDAIVKLRKKISNESLQERSRLEQTHRYYSTRHQLRSQPAVAEGVYLNPLERQQLPRALVDAGLPVPALPASRYVDRSQRL